MTQQDDLVFEAEVRRISTELFPKATAAGPVLLDGRERDGVYSDGETMHIVEATTSKRQDKAEHDLKKSADLVVTLRRHHQETNFKIWLVTLNDPTADQIKVIPNVRKKSKCPIEVCSFRQFASKLVDASNYLQLRDNHPFGSVRRPENEHDFHVPRDEFIPIDLIDPANNSMISPKDIANMMTTSPQLLLLVGDYGAGKSMTLREAFYQLKRDYLIGQTYHFPVYINLQDHFGQDNPSEALIRHATEIGFPMPNQLVAAWKAGHCHIFLDGFDELSSTRLVRGFRGLRQARKQAMRLVYNFIRLRPSDVSIFVSGRQHYFDSMDELGKAFGLETDFRYFTLNEFSHEQVASYLKKKGFSNAIPDWLPSRPLLLGYLAIRGAFDSTDQDGLLGLPREEGWDHLLDRICQREAHQIDPISIEPHAVREFVERVATQCRRTTSGRGPILLDELRRIFETVFSMPPDEKAEILIFRMPGFTSASGQEDAREFIDDEYADACRSGDVIRFVENPHDVRLDDLTASSIEMDELGCCMTARKFQSSSSKQISVSLEIASKQEAPYLSFDILRVLQQLNRDYTGAEIVVREGIFDSYEVTEQPDFSKIVLEECVISNVDIASMLAIGPRFRNCHVEKVYGAVGVTDMPPSLRGSKSSISFFVDEAQTNSDILDLDIPVSLRVMMTILRKLFVQPGRGRKENALYRGLDSRARSYVPDILKLVSEESFAHPHRVRGPVVWIPNRSLTKRAYGILKSPQKTSDSLAIRVRSL